MRDPAYHKNGKAGQNYRARLQPILEWVASCQWWEWKISSAYSCVDRI